MAIKTQVRLAQVTGSLPTFKPASFGAGGTAANPVRGPLVTVQNLDGVLSYFAQALSNIHGDLEYGDKLPGEISFSTADPIIVRGAHSAAAQQVLLGQNDGTNADGLKVDLSSTGTAAGSFLQLQNTGGTGAAAIDINALAGGIDIDAAGAFSVLGGAGVDILTSDDQTLVLGEGIDDAAHTMIRLIHDAGTATNEKILIQNAAGTTGDAVKVYGKAGGVTIESDATLTNAILVDSAGGIDVNSATEMDFTTSNAAGHIAFTTVHTAGMAFQVNANTHADAEMELNAGILDVNVTGAATLDSSAAGIALGGVLDSAFVVNASGEHLSLEAKGGGAQVLSVVSAGTGTNAIDIDASAGGIDIDGQLAVDIQSVAAGVSIGGVLDSDFTVAANGQGLALAVSGGGAQVLSLGSAGTGTNAVDINATAGGIDIDAQTAIDMLSTTTTTVLATTTLSLKGNTGATFGDDTQHIVYDGSGNCDFDAVGLDLDATDNSAMTVTGAAKSLQIDVVGGGAQKLLLQSAGTGVDAIHIDASAGGIEINVPDEKTLALGLGGAVEIMLQPSATAGNEKSNWTNTNGNSTRAIMLEAVAGGLMLSGSGGLQLSGSGAGLTFSADNDGNRTDQGMDPLLGGAMGFARYHEFETFRSKSMFSNSTTVIGALNALADSASDSEPTLFGLILSADIAAGADVTVAKLAGETASLVKTVGEQNARVYVNGQLMKSSSGGVTNDYLIQDTNDLRFQFDLKDEDVVQVMDYSL